MTLKLETRNSKLEIRRANRQPRESRFCEAVDSCLRGNDLSGERFSNFEFRF
jgi:hypothetical protein